MSPTTSTTGPRHLASPSGRTQAVYYRYRDRRGNDREPVDEFLEELLESKAIAVAKIDDQIEEHLNGQRPESPPPAFPISSQVEGELRELRVRFAKSRYRILYQRSGNLIVLLHIFEKNTGQIPAKEKRIAQQRFEDFKRRMDASPRLPPRAAGRDSPPRTGRAPR